MTAPAAFRETLPPAEVRELFAALAADWKAQAKYLSDTRRMVLLKPYQRIIGLGRPVVPLILEDLRREPDHWFWALEAITGENPYRPEVEDGFAKFDLGRAAEAWLEWGRQHQLV